LPVMLSSISHQIQHKKLHSTCTFACFMATKLILRSSVELRVVRGHTLIVELSSTIFMVCMQNVFLPSHCMYQMRMIRRSYRNAHDEDADGYGSTDMQ